VNALEERLQLAISLHRAGELAKARDAYAQVLQRDPGNFPALHLSGVVASQTGNAQLAVQLIWRAIEINPANAAAYCDLGSALKQLNHLQGALASYDRALVLDDALADAHSNRGTVLSELHRFDEALASLDRAIALRPNFAAASLNRGNALKGLNRLDAALAAYDRTIAMNPRYAEAHFNKGCLLMGMRRWPEALASFGCAISIRPYPEALLNRGIVLKEMGRLQEALADLESAIALDGHCAEALSNRGVVLGALGHHDAALASFDEAMTVKPLYAEAHGNKGNARLARSELDQALACYDRAISLKPDFPEAHSGRGIVLTQMRRFDEAFVSFDTAVALKPDYAEAYFNRALASLTLGRFDSGWLDYEWRRKCAGVASDPAGERFTEPPWRGDEPLSGRTILLWWEQGLGDTLQFCRYAALVADLGASVILEVQPPLLGVVATLPRILVVKPGDARPRFDFQCPLMSLPLAFKTTLSTIPSAGNYLRTDPAKVDYWRARLGPGEKPRIGLVWSGSRVHKNDRNRSLPLSLLLEFLPPEIQCISLQVDVREIDRATLDQRPDILDCGASCGDFADTAALCQCLDLVISVDTSVAHLSAAIGKQTWVLLPFAPDWRWLLDRSDSPWYEAVSLYRQDAAGEWTEALARLRDDLAQQFSCRRSHS
jgi:tetratricopeptide (TPR) repeat protein